jgi:ParB family chromosome partitioning protein
VAKIGLGKGLGALIQDSPEGPAPEGKELRVPIDKVRPNPGQPRRQWDEGSLNELADSIRELGVIQPVIVEEDGEGYRIVAGERRYRAAKIAGLTELPVLVKSLSEERRLEVALVENIQREDLNPMDEAMAYRQLMELGPMSQEDVARKVGKNRSTVANALRLLKLPEKVRDAISRGELSAGHARALLACPDEASMLALFARVLAEGLSVREAERLAAATPKKPQAASTATKAAPPRPVELRDLEERLIAKFGTKALVRGDGSKGSIELAYFSPDELDRLIEALLSE